MCSHDADITWFNSTRDEEMKTITNSSVYKTLNSYRNVDINILFKHKSVRSIPSYFNLQCVNSLSNSWTTATLPF